MPRYRIEFKVPGSKWKLVGTARMPLGGDLALLIVSGFMDEAEAGMLLRFVTRGGHVALKSTAGGGKKVPLRPGPKKSKRRAARRRRPGGS